MLTALISRTCLQVWSLSLSLYVMCRAADLWTSNPGLLHQGPWRPWVSATHFSSPPHPLKHTHMYTHGQHHWHLRAKYTASDNDRWTGSSTDRRARTWEVTGCECMRGVRACKSVRVCVRAHACVNGTEGVAFECQGLLIVDYPSSVWTGLRSRTQPSCGSPSSLSQLVWLKVTDFTSLFVWSFLVWYKELTEWTLSWSCWENLPGEDATRSTGESTVDRAVDRDGWRGDVLLWRLLDNFFFKTRGQKREQKTVKG